MYTSGTAATNDPTCYFGCTWVHQKTKREYEIVCFAIEETTLTPVVVYRSMGDCVTWTRPCAEFFDGRFQQKPIQTVTTGTTL